VILNSGNLQYLRNGKIHNVFLRDSFCPVINQFIRCSNGHDYAIADGGLYRFEKDHFSNIVLNGLTEIDGDKNLGHVTELDSFLVINMNVFTPAVRAPKRFFIYNYKTGKAFTDTTLPDVYFTERTAQNELVIATSKGVFSLDRDALKKQQIKLLPPPEIYFIPPNTVPNRLYIDREQNLWMVTSIGVFKFSPNKPGKLFSVENGLPSNAPSFIFQDREGIMWFGNTLAGAIKLVDQELQFYKEFKPGFFVQDISIPVGTDSVWMYNQSRHLILLNHHDVIHEFAVNQNEFSEIVMGKEKFYGINSYTMYQLHVVRGNSFTASPLYTISKGEAGLNCLILDKNENPIVIGNSIVVVLPGNKVIKQPLDYFTDKAVLTKDNFLFIATRSASIYIFRIDPSDPDHYLQLIQKYKWPDDLQPRSTAIDTSGRLWIATRRRGLLCYNITNEGLKFFRQLTVKDGLSENFIKEVYCDASNFLWAGSPSGLDKISFENNDFHIENVTKASNMYLDVWKAISDREGVVWVLATSGLLKVYPSQQTLASVKPGIVLTRFAVNNLEQSFTEKELVLKYFQNNLSFQVAAPSFFDEKKTLFSYKLDETWNAGTWTEPSSQSDISFINLSPGHYHLKIRSIFLNGKYQPLESDYFFAIRSPWWKSWWFVCVEFVAALSVIITFFRLYYRNKLQKQLISLEKKQAIEKERTRIATDMHDDMGAGLSRIKVLSETIKFENQKGIVNPTLLQKISAYSEEMMDKMGEIVWALNQRNDSMNDLLGYTRAYAVDYLTTHGIDCAFHAPAEHQEIFVSGEMRRNIFLSVKEVLHNVVKHAGATNVDIMVTVNKELCIRIHDNGKGIDLQNKRKFGNGVNNIMKRMKEVGGFAEFKNENGTSVKLQISLS
jgi:signal transduction histidine kinase